MAKRKNKERYHIELRKSELTETQFTYAVAILEKILDDVDPSLYFKSVQDNTTQSHHWVFRDYKLGKLMQEAIDEERSRYTDSHGVWVYRHWVQPPNRTMLGLFDEEGLVAAVAPGDDFIGTMFQSIKGKETKGYFNNHDRQVDPDIGHIHRLWFQGRSRDVWEARRVFRRVMNDHQNPDTYLNPIAAIETAVKRLSEHSSIVVVNSANDVFRFTRYGVEASPFMSVYDWGEAWIHEHKLVGVGITRNDVIYKGPAITDFRHRVMNAVAKQQMKRRATQ